VDTQIIGAGLTGLVAANQLAAEGVAVRLVDKGRSVGGRLATRRIGTAVLDHGAQFFTARSDAFSDAVDGWLSAGVVEEWCRGFDEVGDGYPRYRTAGGMNQLAKHLRTTLPDSVEILTSHKASAIIPLSDRLAVSYDSGVRAPDECDAVISTAPVPQGLELLDSGGLAMSPSTNGVRDLRYHAVIGLLATLDRPAPFGTAGAQQTPDDPVFTFRCDNGTKGISPVPAATFHAAHELSAQLWSETNSDILAALQPHAEAALGDTSILQIQVKKWRYAGPVEPWPDRCAVVATTPGPVIFAGDAFGGPKIEGAFLSGIAAAEAVLAARPAES
jgi:renalase